MQICRLFTIILILLILSVIFQGTNAHESIVEGYHDYSLVTGFAHAVIYHHLPRQGVFTASATCSVWASEPWHSDKFISGNYDIKAHTYDALFIGPGEPADTKADYFRGDLMKHVSDTYEKEVTFTGLVAHAKGGGNATVYLNIISEGKPYAL